YYVVAHLHYVLFGGSVFAIFAAFYYWIPKMSGRLMNERLGKLHFWLMLIGFNLTFFPMHQLGIDGMNRRIADYSASTGWQTLNLLSTAGTAILALSITVFLINFFTSMRKGDIAGDDPWSGNTLEWATTSPPPPHNFTHIPPVKSERPVYDMRNAGQAAPAGELRLPEGDVRG
ncbi:MAG: cbb3-type cytochrome c oxidase subunit I, partial [Actinobacteria bacterium]|nr:cbb3-type cytochrome c oxidase subunit I [Actinomycetota bacterium]